MEVSIWIAIVSGVGVPIVGGIVGLVIRAKAIDMQLIKEGQ